MNDKIGSDHLERRAYIYIRQSSLQQVQHNVESNRRQYALAERARHLGFETVIVVDDDLGVSGAGSRERPGFSRLLAAVCNGEVGAVFALEASRLARNNRDWHHLIDLCVLTRTLVIDADGIYDPRLLNDRLLLGLKGTMSEFELGLLRQRAQEAYHQKALRGEVLTRVPIGYVRKGSTGIEMTPDRQVQEAIRGLFVRFAQSGSLRQVLLWHHQEKVLFPVSRLRDGTDSVEWLLPNYQHLLRIVKNPTYAGAFAWGRTAVRSRVVDGRSRKTEGHRLGMDQWQVLLKDHHDGYISWNQYMENVRTLESNSTRAHQIGAGAARSGNALLAGLLRCALRAQAPRRLSRRHPQIAAVLLRDGRQGAGQSLLRIIWRCPGGERHRRKRARSLPTSGYRGIPPGLGRAPRSGGPEAQGAGTRSGEGSL